MALDTLWGNKIDIAIARMREFEPPEGYWLAFSGGKDSQVVYHLALEAGVKFEAHFSVTAVDPPELLRFIKANYPEVIWDRPEKSMWQLIVDCGMPPTRIIRYCCAKLKEDRGIGRLVITGVRSEESAKRKHRGLVEGCTAHHKTYLHAIVDWTEDDVWEYHRLRGLPHCCLYDEGWTRIGCILCPMNTQKERDIARWPRVAENYRRACNKAFERRLARGDAMTWQSGDDMFAWWISELAGPEEDNGQMPLFA